MCVCVFVSLWFCVEHCLYWAHLGAKKPAQLYLSDRALKVEYDLLKQIVVSFHLEVHKPSIQAFSFCLIPYSFTFLA